MGPLTCAQIKCQPWPPSLVIRLTHQMVWRIMIRGAPLLSCRPAITAHIAFTAPQLTTITTIYGSVFLWLQNETHFCFTDDQLPTHSWRLTLWSMRNYLTSHVFNPLYNTGVGYTLYISYSFDIYLNYSYINENGFHFCRDWLSCSEFQFHITWNIEN